MTYKLKSKTLIFVITVIIACSSWRTDKATNVDYEINIMKTVYIGNHTFYTAAPNDFVPATASGEELKKPGILGRSNNDVVNEKCNKKMTRAKWISPQVEQIPENMRIGQRLSLCE